MVKHQLRVYYGLRGLIGKALAHAIKLDMLSLERQGGPGFDSDNGIRGAVVWGDSEEGREYWQERHETWPVYGEGW